MIEAVIVNLTQQTHQRWYLVENESLVDVDLSMLFQPLIFGWRWKFGRRRFIDVVSTLAKQRWSNFDRITSIQRWWTNFVSTLILGW